MGLTRSINDIFKSAQAAFNQWSKLDVAERTTARLLRMLSFDFFEVLDAVTIARSRKHIERYYDTADIGKFPERLAPISRYPELTDLENEHPSIVNVHVDVRENKKDIEFRYRVIPGKADKSYGINVARLAHLPKVVLERASQLLKDYESQQRETGYQPSLFVMDSVQPEKSKLLERIENLDVDSMSPRDALDCLYELKKMADGIDD